MRRTVVAIAAALALGVALVPADGFAGSPTTVPPTTTEPTTTTTGPPSVAALEAEVGPGTDRDCDIGDPGPVTSYSWCHRLTNTGTVTLTFVTAERTLTIDGIVQDLPDPPPAPTLVAGAAQELFEFGPLPSLVGCEPGQTLVPIQTEHAVAVDVTWTFEDPQGNDIEAAASASWTLLADGRECIGPVDQPPTFTG
jgi:hypothetical protein